MSELLQPSISRQTRKYAKAVLNPLLGMLRPGNVAMFHVGRVGSTVLVGMLQQHRRIYWAGEVFQREHDRYMKAAEGSYSLPKDPLKELRAEMREARNRMFGFETKFLDEHHLKVIGLDLERYVDTLSELGFERFVVLKRKNILRRLISGAVLRETGQFHIRAGQKRQKRRFHLDVHRIPIGARHLDLIDAIRMIEEGHARLDSLLAGKQVCQLNYEEHISDDPFVAYRKAIEFMGLKPEKPDILLRKTNPDPLEETIENYDELREMIGDTPYRWMLENA
ncbi:hypothetical protein L598_000200000680 [Mesorhizobium sp. J18]|uniref:hypothetical protein n=1 Tax=Mesorhizobium sp. J18 TaxID=935263 RepID=UPI0011990C3B|nr:hypothetical protein [Mesorhizobium sp. J18]TWG97929.1 hypothetical protein L598_000200000680 [Mesorhizobium sp. J18]